VRHIPDHDRAGADERPGADFPAGDHADLAADENGFRDLDVTGEVALRADRRPVAHGDIVAYGRAEVDRHEIAELDVAGQNRARAKDDPLAEFHALTHQDGRMDKGDENRSGLEHWLSQSCFGRRQAKAAKIDPVWRRLMPPQRCHRSERSVVLERIQIVVEEAGEFPIAPIGRVTQNIGVQLPAEAACAYDIQLFHDGNFSQRKVAPPSTTKSCPVIQRESGESMKETAPATSAVVPAPKG